MCTVTVIPLKDNNFVLTSNRDEAPNRISLVPEFYKHHDKQLLYPKDKQSEGSWIGLSESKRLICLLNGGFEIHKRQPEYRLSRGVVVKDLLVAKDIEEAIEAYNLNNIEPFTIVVVEWENELRFYELVWDGSKKHFQKLPLQPKVWSSSTLYNKSMRKERQQWFDDFIKDKDLDADVMFEFHTKTQSDNTDYGVIMDRGFVKTTSITRVIKKDEDIEMRYFDLDSNTHYSKTLESSEIIHGK